MTFEIALAQASARPFDPVALDQLANKALEEAEEERALPLLDRAVAQSPTARLWQWKGLLERAIDEHERAIRSYTEAARLGPTEPSIAHGLARVAMEAGLDARSYYETARRLAPRNGQIVIGHAAAMVAAGRGDDAVGELEAAVNGSPMWLQGYEYLAQVLATQGRGSEATEALERTIAANQAHRPLWETLLNIQLRRGSYGSLAEIVDRAEQAGISSPEFQIYRAIHAAEFDDDPFPAALFGARDPAIAAELGRWQIRHLLRVGEVDAALPIVDAELRRNPSGEIWAYASTAWRAAGDPRWQWLEGDPSLISVVDISDTLPPLEQLAETLRGLHLARGEYLDQSVRGGTQTDGPLLCRIDPTIRHLRAAIVGAVERHVAQLPPPDPRHPLLAARRDRRVRFSGSWSVRLRSGGHHSNHIHQMGWISSALYVSLPEKSPEDPADAGWFTLGQPDKLIGTSLQAWRKIEPRPGTLVLFPSFMWHGTVPFEQGERLTVAFDVALPR